MAADGNLNENWIKEMTQEPLPAETTSISAPDKLVESSDSPPPEPLGQDKGTACDAPVASIGEEKDPQDFTADQKTNVPGSFSEESAGKANIFSSLNFPKKLWQLVESDEFKSIWWGHSGNCVVIAEETFKVEVLGRRRPLRIFETESMKSFIRQLNLYGFTKMQKDFQRSPSLPEFLAEEDAFSAHKKLLYYYNPNFKRDAPHLLENCKRRAALKRKALQAGLDESCPSSIPDAQPGWRAAAMDVGDLLAAALAEDTQPAAPAGSPLPKHYAKATPQDSGAHTTSQGAAPTLPDPAAAAGRDEQQPQASTVPLHPNAGATKVPCAALPPFNHPLFPVAMMAAASAIAMLMPPNWQSPAAPHCPTCTCSQDGAAAGDRMAP